MIKKNTRILEEIDVREKVTRIYAKAFFQSDLIRQSTYTAIFYSVHNSRRFTFIISDGDDIVCN